MNKIGETYQDNIAEAGHRQRIFEFLIKDLLSERRKNMHTILGANGQIAEELARELRRNYTTVIRLVSRNPKKANNADETFPANLLNSQATDDAVKGSEIAYLTVGLPMDSQLWEEQFPVMMRSAIDACKKHRCKLVFFDNTYMYAKTASIKRFLQSNE